MIVVGIVAAVLLVGVMVAAAIGRSGGWAEFGRQFREEWKREQEARRR